MPEGQTVSRKRSLSSRHCPIRATWPPPLREALATFLLTGDERLVDGERGRSFFPALSLGGRREWQKSQFYGPRKDCWWQDVLVPRNGNGLEVALGEPFLRVSLRASLSPPWSARPPLQDTSTEKDFWSKMRFMEIGQPSWLLCNGNSHSVGVYEEMLLKGQRGILPSLFFFFVSY